MALVIRIGRRVIESRRGVLRARAAIVPIALLGLCTHSAQAEAVPELERVSARPPRWERLGVPEIDRTPSSHVRPVQNPRRIAEGPPGLLLVSDRRLRSIVAVDKTTLEPVWSSPLTGNGAPFGLATLGRLVYVGNTETKSVEVYRMIGPRRGCMRFRFAYDLGDGPPGEGGTIENPTSIAIDRGERLVFVLDAGSRQIRVFDWKGAAVGAFSPEDSAGRLLSPVSVTVDETRREVLVSDYGDPAGSFRPTTAARILVFTYDGEPLFEISGDGSTHPTTRFVRVQGIATDAGGRIFAADPLGGRILVLDRTDGAMLDELGAPGDAPGQLRLPVDVLLDSETGDLFVSNVRGTRKVEVFRGAAR